MVNRSCAAYCPLYQYVTFTCLLWRHFDMCNLYIYITQMKNRAWICIKCRSIVSQPSHSCQGEKYFEARLENTKQKPRTACNIWVRLYYKNYQSIMHSHMWNASVGCTGTNHSSAATGIFRETFYQYHGSWCPGVLHRQHPWHGFRRIRVPLSVTRKSDVCGPSGEKWYKRPS